MIAYINADQHQTLTPMTEKMLVMRSRWVANNHSVIQWPHWQLRPSDINLTPGWFGQLIFLRRARLVSRDRPSLRLPASCHSVPANGVTLPKSPLLSNTPADFSTGIMIYLAFNVNECRIQTRHHVIQYWAVPYKESFAGGTVRYYFHTWSTRSTVHAAAHANFIPQYLAR